MGTESVKVAVDTDYIQRICRNPDAFQFRKCTDFDPVAMSFIAQSLWPSIELVIQDSTVPIPNVTKSKCEGEDCSYFLQALRNGGLATELSPYKLTEEMLKRRLNITLDIELGKSDTVLFFYMLRTYRLPVVFHWTFRPRLIYHRDGAEMKKEVPGVLQRLKALTEPMDVTLWILLILLFLFCIMTKIRVGCEWVFGLGIYAYAFNLKVQTLGRRTIEVPPFSDFHDLVEKLSSGELRLKFFSADDELILDVLDADSGGLAEIKETFESNPALFQTENDLKLTFCDLIARHRHEGIIFVGFDETFNCDMSCLRFDDTLERYYTPAWYVPLLGPQTSLPRLEHANRATIMVRVAVMI